MYEVSIFIFDFVREGKRKEIYPNVVKCHDGISFPFDNVHSCMCLLYPDKMIEFVSSL